MTNTRLRWLVPAGVFTAVLAAVVAIAAVSGGGSRPAARKLPLSAGAGGGARNETTAAADSQLGAPAYYGGRYRLVGTLPEDLPKEGPAYRLPGGSADADAVRRLARALGIQAEPQRVEHAWKAGTGPVLYVQDAPGFPWSYEPKSTECAPDAGRDCAVASDADVATAPGMVCPEPAPGTEPVTEPTPCKLSEPSPPPGPSEADTLAVARALLERTGYDVAPAQAWTEPGWGSRTAMFRPTLGGLPVYWWESSVTVLADQTVQRANGWLAQPVSEGDYPLLTPQQAIDRAAAAPQYQTMIACDSTAPECSTEPPTRDVTGVRLGLVSLPSYAGDAMYLAPAWLLTVQDAPQAEPLLALPDDYLEPPPSPAPPPTGEPPTKGDGPTPVQVDGAGGSEPNQGADDPRPAPEPAKT